MEERFTIPGSEAGHDPGGLWISADLDQRISPTIVIRRQSKAGDVSQKLLSGSWQQISREEAETFMRVDPADLSTVLAFAQGNALTVLAQNAEARTVQVEGTLPQVGRAFGIEIKWYVDPSGQKYLSYQGPLSVPSNLQDIVEAVLGLDQRPIARRGAAR